MATREQHLGQARHNERFLTTFDLSVSPYLDWAVTVIFYAALHYLRALAARYGFISISSYVDEDRTFARLSVLRRNAGIYADYRQLKDDSRAARYEMRRLTPQEVSELRDEELYRIREVVLANL